MNGHTRIEILLRCPHLNGNPKALQNLTTPKTNNVQAYNFFLRPLHHKFVFSGVQFLFLVWVEIIEHVGEAGVIGFDVFSAVLGDGGGFGKANGADFRVGEDGGGNVAVREVIGSKMRAAAGVVRAKEPVGERAAGSDGH